MDNNKYSLNENQIKTILAVFGDLKSIPYEELNKRLGSITIDEMNILYNRLNDWYQENILNSKRDEEYDEECKWYNDPYYVTGLNHWYENPYDENGIYY